MIHEDILQILTTEEKDAFLLNALNTIPHLREQFEQQFAGKAPKSDIQSTFEQFCSVVEEQRKYWMNEFESLDLENPDWESWTPPHRGYIADYEACNLAEINDDNYTLSDDPNDYLLGSYTEAMQKVVSKAALCHFNPLVLGEAVEHTLHYISKEGISSGVLIQQLDELFKQIGNDQMTLPCFTKALLQLPHAGPLFPRLSILIARHNDPDSWPEQAEKLFPYDDQVARDLMLLFYGLLLAEEKQYTQLLEMLQREQHISFQDYEALLEIIAEEMPERGFDLIRAKISNLLSKQRGRDLYEHFVKCLVTIRNPGNKKELSEFITTLYNHKPSLHALRDELRKAGLV